MRKYIMFCLVVFICLFCTGERAYAETGDRYQLRGSDNLLAIGGINSYDEVDAQSRYETEILEYTLLNDGYIQVSGEGRDLSDEEYERFVKDNNLWFVPYMEINEFNLVFRKVFVYKPVYDDYMEQKYGGSGEEEYTIGELITSTVVLDIAFWEYAEKSGTFDDEINDKIPSYSVTGYLEIHSPINCEVILWNDELNRYYRFHIEKDTPFLVKLKRGSYRVTEINGYTVNTRIDDDGEDALPYHNRIQLLAEHTKDNPYLLDFTKLTIKYDLIDVDKMEETDEKKPLPTRVPVPKEEVQVKDIEDDAKKSNGTNFVIILVVIIILLLLASGIITFIKKREVDDDEYIG